MRVYVRNKEGRPLMPTNRNRHVRILLKSGRAEIACYKPFTIRLLYETPDIVQDLYGGTDPGRTNVGNAVVNTKGETVYGDHMQTTNKDVPKRMAERAAHRRASRNGERKRRQRRAKAHHTQMCPPVQKRVLPGCEKPITIHSIRGSEARFANRKRSEHWLTPTARHLIETTLNQIDFIGSILPVRSWTLEINKFAFMELENGTVRGIDFQTGRMKGYKSTDAYIHAQQNGKCALCDGPVEHVHHIVPRSRSGSDRPENLVGLCSHCHEQVHKDDSVKARIAKIGENKRWHALSILNQAVPYIYQGLVERFGEPNVHVCKGFETAAYRQTCGLIRHDFKHSQPMDHVIDAVCIAGLGAGMPSVSYPENHFGVRQFRRHDRARINNQRERVYQQKQIVRNKEGKHIEKWVTVAKNRKKRTEQKDPSLEEFIRSLPKEQRRTARSRIVNKKNLTEKQMKELPIGSIRVVPSCRRYNDTKRLLPGTVFMYEGKRYVLSGQITNGKYLRAFGEGDKNFPADKCRIVGRGGLVYL